MSQEKQFKLMAYEYWKLLVEVHELLIEVGEGRVQHPLYENHEETGESKMEPTIPLITARHQKTKALLKEVTEALALAVELLDDLSDGTTSIYDPDYIDKETRIVSVLNRAKNEQRNQE